jgi:hypothetical protein
LTAPPRSPPAKPKLSAEERRARQEDRRRGSNQGNTQNEKTLCHQSSIDFRCYLELARSEPRRRTLRPARQHEGRQRAQPLDGSLDCRLDPGHLRVAYPEWLGLKAHPFQGVFYLQFASTYWVYAQVWRLVLTVCSTRSRAFCGEVIPAGRVRYTKRATNGANACDFRRLAHLAQARQDPERGGA